MKIVLASGSPRRREILARIAYPFDVRPADLDESRIRGEAPQEYVARLAADKALAVGSGAPDALVLGSDTAVVLGNEILGKPADPADAARMLSRLSGRRHQVLSGVAISRGDQVLRRFVSKTDVEFRDLSDREIEQYVATGEPLDKAGAYAIQGEAGRFVRGVYGSVTGVIGLPFEETREALYDLGVSREVEALPADAIALRFRAVRGEVAARAVAAGRPYDSVRLISVTKGHPASGMEAVLAAGASDIGENYVQEARAKRDALGSGGARWHLIGPLQRNKAGVAASVFDVVHTIERVETAAAIARRRPDGAAPAEVLLQVNVARDPAKAGVAPDAVDGLVDAVARVEGVRLVGLMTIARAEDPGRAAAGTFAELRELRDRLRADGHPSLVELSMGMSGDYDAAIEQGATWVRLGTAILGPRPPRREA